MRTALESVAAYGSVSYGLLAPERLRAVLLGDVASPAERVQIHQALTETPPYRLATLARELAISSADLDRRVEQLFGHRLEETTPWTRPSA
ncbi:hypothetical protein V5F40_21525 [Xanthobacter sp. DSM 14520]|uniref:hypothetical protein n=1 Tax=Xanthobacter autotrophicus (strain ATCC BAA-1158 / Py2) TaxID=78245 RepID=UPI0037278D7E